MDKAEDSSSYYLIEAQPKILGNKLPSIKDVHAYFLFQHVNKKLPVRQASTMTCFEIMLFWGNAGIKTRHTAKCIEKIEKLYRDYQYLKKSKPASKENLFLANLENLSDVAHMDALHNCTEEAKQFLVQQRLNGEWATRRNGWHI